MIAVVRIGLAVALVIAVGFGADRAAADPQGCSAGPFGGSVSVPLKCSREFVVGPGPRRFVATHAPVYLMAVRWVMPDGSDFATGTRTCRNFGRSGPIRVREVTCDGRLVVYVRATAPAQRVRLEWETFTAP